MEGIQEEPSRDEVSTAMPGRELGRGFSPLDQDEPVLGILMAVLDRHNL